METLSVKIDSELPGLMTITLNRPEKLNAVNSQMLAELQTISQGLQTDDEIRVVMLTGAGRAFSSGWDLDTNDAEGARTVLQERIRVGSGNRTCALLEGLDQVTIAAINGLTIGAGLALASCVDIRLAAQSAWFSIPEVDRRFPLAWNALPRLMRELGPARTKELVMTCDRFSSNDAERWGFVNRVFADGELMAQARSLAGRILSKDALAIAVTKSATTALADAMVPGLVTYGDREQLMLARRERSPRTRRT